MNVGVAVTVIAVHVIPELVVLGLLLVVRSGGGMVGRRSGVVGSGGGVVGSGGGVVGSRRGVGVTGRREGKQDGQGKE